MVQINMPIIDEKSIISNKIYMADKVSPVAIQQNSQNKEIYDILFIISQDIDESMIYFQVSVKIEDNLDKNHILKRPIYINNILQDKVKNKAFREMIENLDADKFYIGDFNFINDNTANHIIRGYKELTTKDNKKYFEQINIHIPRYMYIILNIYLDNIMEPFSDIENPESLFLNSDMRRIRFEKIEDVKLVATCKYKRKNRGQVITYNTHYEMNCGPKTFKFNYEVVTKENHEVITPLAESIFVPEYSQYDDKFIGLVKDKECYYIIIYDKDNNIKGLKITDELLEKTNILDPRYIFVDKNIEDEEILPDDAIILDSESDPVEVPESQTFLIPVDSNTIKALQDGTITPFDLIKNNINIKSKDNNKSNIILPPGI